MENIKNKLNYMIKHGQCDELFKDFVLNNFTININKIEKEIESLSNNNNQLVNQKNNLEKRNIGFFRFFKKLFNFNKVKKINENYKKNIEYILKKQKELQTEKEKFSSIINTLKKYKKLIEKGWENNQLKKENKTLTLNLENKNEENEEIKIKYLTIKKWYEKNKTLNDEIKIKGLEEQVSKNEKVIGELVQENIAHKNFIESGNTKFISGSIILKKTIESKDQEITLLKNQIKELEEEKKQRDSGIEENEEIWKTASFANQEATIEKHKNEKPKWSLFTKVL